ncbi:MAG: hypothetical protein GMKNLPBB_00158 [Myxococcota bacterium]|nr:hypothetical protein [Myxococcota bacterium]
MTRLQRQLAQLAAAAAALSVLGVGAWLALNGNPSGDGMGRPEKLLPVGANDIQRISWSMHGEPVEIVRESREQRWRLNSPAKADAEQWVAEGMAQALGETSVTLIADETKSREDKYGLANPEAAFKITTFMGQDYTVSLGLNDPIGANVYVQRSSDRKILLAPSSLVSRIKQTSFNVRDKRLLPVERDEIARIAVIRDGKLSWEIARDNENSTRWNLIAPFQERADKIESEGAVAMAMGLRAEGVVTETPKDRDKFGLDTPPLVIQVVTRDGKTLSAHISRQDASTYGVRTWAWSMEFNAIAQVDDKTMDGFQIDPARLRSRSIIEFEPEKVVRMVVNHGGAPFVLQKTGDSRWSLMDPVRGPASAFQVNSQLNLLANMRAQSIVEENAANLQQFGLQPAQFAVSLYYADRPKPVDELLIGIPSANFFYARSSRNNRVFQLSMDNQRLIHFSPAPYMAERAGAATATPLTSP